MSNDRSSSRRHGVWSHWIPLAVTVTVATVGLAAWALSQRNGNEEEEEAGPHHADLDYDHADYGDNPPYGASFDAKPGPPVSSGGAAPPPSGGNNASREAATAAAATAAAMGGRAETAGEGGGNNAATWQSRMSGALRRTPSPQQLLDGASKTVAAGVAAMGATVGTALGTIREDGAKPPAGFDDHETWSEEADAKKSKGGAGKGGAKDPSRKRKSVAIVVSADTHAEDYEMGGYIEHAVCAPPHWRTGGRTLDCANSMDAVHFIAHTPEYRFHKGQVIYSHLRPGPSRPCRRSHEQSPAGLAELVLLQHQPQPGANTKRRDQEFHVSLRTPAPNSTLQTHLLTNPRLNATTSNPVYNAMYTQALGLVERETMVMPFSSPGGHVHILTHIKPEVMYVQESLGGDDGANVARLQQWSRHDIVLVVGAEDGAGGLADSEPEGPPAKGENTNIKWWQKEERVGRGRGVVVVDGVRVHDDWQRRVENRD